jgi:hypothetical protein
MMNDLLDFLLGLDLSQIFEYNVANVVNNECSIINLFCPDDGNVFCETLSAKIPA